MSEVSRQDMHLKWISAETKIPDLRHNLPQLGYMGLSPLDNFSVCYRAPKVYLRLDSKFSIQNRGTR